jgi:DNA repair exonuclease SbcCD ATPase subunit
MNIKKLTLSNFKRFDKSEFEFGDINILEGKNGTGKSAIKDAIIFCLFNRTADGAVTKTEKLIKSGERNATVEMVFSNGESLKRVRSRTSTKLSYLDSSQTEEDSNINQEQIEDIIGTDYDTFQCVFNVGYFMSLPDKEKREIMLRLAKPIDRQALFEKFQIGKDLIKKYGLKATDIQGQYKEFLKEKRELEHFIEVKNLELQNIEDIKIPKMEFKDQSDILTKTENLLAEGIRANESWREYNNKLSDISLIQAKNKEIEDSIKNIEIEEINKPSNSKVVALYKEREKFLEEKEQLSKSSPHLILINQLKEQINELKNIVSIPQGKCPTCLQEISDEHKNKVNEYNSEIIGKKGALDKRLEQAKVEWKKEYDSIEEKIKKLAEQIVEEETNYDVQWIKFKENEENKTTLRVMKARIQEVKEPKKPETQKADIEKLQDDREKFKVAQGKYIVQKTEVESLEKRLLAETAKKNELTEKKKTAEEELKEVKLLASIFSPKGIPAEEMRMKLEPIVALFNEMIPDSKIELLEIMKSGMEYREVFQVFVKEKEYIRMSTGEKKKVDIAISKIINKLSGSKLNIFFIDNAEAIDKIPNLVTQSFLARVTQDKELKLTVEKSEEKEISPF